MSDPVLTYGVWIRGQGWLKRDDPTVRVADRTFASVQREVAESAAALWGRDARVLPMDGSLIDFEQDFLKHQAAKRWWAWITYQPTSKKMPAAH